MYVGNDEGIASSCITKHGRPRQRSNHSEKIKTIFQVMWKNL